LFVSRAREIQYYSSQKQATEAQRLVLVLWLNEDAMPRPVADFADLLGRLRLNGRVKETVNAKLILAAGSDALQRAITRERMMCSPAGPADRGVFGDIDGDRRIPAVVRQREEGHGKTKHTPHHRQ